MSKFSIHALALAITLATTGCLSLAPKVPTADAAIPGEWPLPPTTQAFTGAVPAVDASAPASAVAVADVGWRDFFADPNLDTLIGRALDNNRDLRVAVLNVDKARAQYRIQRADRVPAVGISTQLLRQGGDNVPVTDQYTSGVGITNFELDLFGRVRSLSQSALQRYFAEEEARRSAQLSLIAEVANAYLTLAADRELLSVSEATLKNQQAAYDLTEKRRELGAVSGLEVSQARTQVEQARADQLATARYKAGRDSYLNQLDAQRTLYGAQQGLVTTRLSEQTNRVTLYKVLGGGWNERSQ